MARFEWKNPHEFEKAGLFGEYSKLSCSTEQLTPIVRAFIRNMNRVRGLGTFPIQAVAIAIINESARMEAMVNLKLPFLDPRLLPENKKFDATLFGQVDAERRRLVAEWMKDHPGQVGIFEIGGYGVNMIIDANLGEAEHAVQSTMAAMLIGLWTSFESLAQDTWITTVNLRPDPLATRVLNRNVDLGTGTQLKSIPPDQIIGQGFDLRRSMGSTLFRLRAVDFQQLKTIRLAYKVAFSDELEPIFEQHHDELFELEAIRNLFVHKGGIIDRKFVERMGNKLELKDKINNSLCVTGGTVAHKAKIVVDCSTQLIQAIDKWITENPASGVDDDS
jgi:hypothetical protein